MPLDPQAEALLAHFNQPDTQIDDSISNTERWLAQGRKAMATVMVRPHSKQVARVENLSIDGPGGELPMRLYHPGGDNPVPLVLYFHGGGFVLCSIDTHDDMCRTLCRHTGAALLSVEYRLAPEAKFPAAPEDCYAALCWAAANAAQLNIDPERLAVAGDSAGGNLAAAAALMARERDGPALRSQVLLCALTSLLLDSPAFDEIDPSYLLNKQGLQRCVDSYLSSPEQRRDPLASPLLAEDLSTMPPAIIVTAEYDPLYDEAEAYGRRLAEAEVPVWMRRYPGMIHGFINMSDFLDRGKEALADVTQQLCAALELDPADAPEAATG